MRKSLLLISALVCSIYMMAADIPDGFYDSINGKCDSVLKSTLSQLVRGGTRYEYGTNQYHSTDDPEGRWHKGDFKAYGTWAALPLTDIHPNGIIWDMYSNCERYYPKENGESGCSLNIEHCLPKSWWGWNKDDTRDSSWVAYKDLFNLNPSDAQANSQKSNYAPGHVTKGDKFDNGSFRMDSKSKSQYNYICYEPEEQYRGDFARTYFYMVTAYEHLDWSSTYSQYVDKSSYRMFSDNITQVLLDWHRADPISEKERCRADQISTIQGNRNPFIDYPELVEYIWGNKQGDTVIVDSLTCAFISGVCPDPITPAPAPEQYDTLINLPGLTKAIVNTYMHDSITGYASDKIQSNGTRSITMGASTTDGYLQFSHLQLTDTATLVFRASVYNTATSMQIDIYADTTLVRTISETVEMCTRNEVQYRTLIPPGTDNIKIISIGQDTKKRACMQELYLLVPKTDSPIVGFNTPTAQESARKELRNGQVIIIRNSAVYSILGQSIR